MSLELLNYCKQNQYANLQAKHKWILLNILKQNILKKK